MSDKKKKYVFHLILYFCARNRRFIPRTPTTLPCTFDKTAVLALEKKQVTKSFTFLFIEQKVVYGVKDNKND
jgi:hypothetical protein